ncbi:S-adenosyl-L-methionine-dependent methyltransferase [Polyplosphaeria fusca]|uniref:S-adenosyl-L-methionine-dependent methyltransferase n=1 Tax=Polyplosphaeria fusca TaxID=682080 RepID=A0A9P4QLD5_9PLEO|nr:S-adenosyl-L-methionine-dependent methyltransferase [Polyplosphaeria fusca]
MSSTEKLRNNPNLARVYAATSLQETQDAYDDWATTYDSDMIEQGYVAPAICAKTVSTHGNIHGAILDAGCGSGGVGLELSKLGAKTIDGIDLSDGMLKVAAKTNAYRNLSIADLSKTLEIGDGAYDALICVGTLTQGHVGPVPALSEFMRIVKSGGFVVATVLESIWEENGFEREIGNLLSEGKTELISKEIQQYRKHAGIGARVLVLKKP